MDLVPSLTQLKIKCQQCSLRSLCLPVGLPESDIQLLDKLVGNQTSLLKGDALFSQGDAFKGFYAVRSGALKYLYQQDPKTPASKIGASQILAFYLPGDFFGLDAIHTEQHPATAIALQNSTVCRVDFDALLKISQQLPSLHRFILNLMSEQACETLSVRLPNQTAEERVMRFLSQLSAHSERRGYSSKQFTLPMQNKDIAHYLGLAVETISRTFADLQQKGVITLSHKTVTLN